MKIYSVRVTVSGRVQGVFFRDFTRKEAERLNLVGHVKNLPNGNVEAFLSGNKIIVEKMIQWFHTGSPLSRVESVESVEIENPERTAEFLVKY